MLALMFWSVGLSVLWGLSTLSSLAFNVLAFTVGMRFVSLDSIKDDQRSFYLYNVGVCITLYRNSSYLINFSLSHFPRFGFPQPIHCRLTFAWSRKRQFLEEAAPPARGIHTNFDELDAVPVCSLQTLSSSPSTTYPLASFAETSLL